MFWEMLIGYVIAGFIGAAIVCLIAGYAVLNGDLKIVTKDKAAKEKMIEEVAKKLAEAEASKKPRKKADK
jgi:hypothetical protein